MNLEYLKIPNEKILELIVVEEEKIRQSVEYQNDCTKMKNIPNGWLDITNNMQKELVKKYGFDDPISNDIACNMLRRARYIFPNNKIFTEVPVYVRCNKANMGNNNKGDDVPDISLNKLYGNKIQLHDLLDTNKITLIIASSHTWQPFRTNIELLNNFYKIKSNVFNIFIIYITEAHAADVWNIGESAGTINYKHKNLEDRFNCIEKFIKTFNVHIPIYSDNMEDEFETKFNSWPFRYFVIKNKKFIEIGIPESSEFDIFELINRMENY